VWVDLQTSLWGQDIDDIILALSAEFDMNLIPQDSVFWNAMNF
jgi:hypothetical protein